MRATLSMFSHFFSDSLDQSQTGQHAQRDEDAMLSEPLSTAKAAQLIAIVEDGVELD